MSEEYQLIKTGSAIEYQADQTANYRALKELEERCPGWDKVEFWGLFVDGKNVAGNSKLDGLENMTRKALKKKVPVLVAQLGTGQSIDLPEE